MARRAALPHRVRGSGRLTTWRAIPLTRTTLTATGGTIINSLDSVELAKRPFTIIRVHLEVMIELDQLVTSEQYLTAIGMCVVSSQANAIGVTAVPTPMTDIESDLWFLHRFMFGNISVGTVVGFEEPGSREYALDTKAQRKVDDDQDVVIVGEVNSTVGDGAIMTVAGRMLIKEH